MDKGGGIGYGDVEYNALDMFGPCGIKRSLGDLQGYYQRIVRKRTVIISFDTENLRNADYAEIALLGQQIGILLNAALLPKEDIKVGDDEKAKEYLRWFDEKVKELTEEIMHAVPHFFLVFVRQLPKALRSELSGMAEFIEIYKKYGLCDLDKPEEMESLSEDASSGEPENIVESGGEPVDSDD